MAMAQKMMLASFDLIAAPPDKIRYPHHIANTCPTYHHGEKSALQASTIKLNKRLNNPLTTPFHSAKNQTDV